MAFAPSKRTRKRDKKFQEMNLSAMMDMMTIILLFLLKSYSSSGALLQPAFDNLPESSSETDPKKTLGIVVSGEGLFADVDTETGERPLISTVQELEDDFEAILPGLENYILKQQERDSDLGLQITDEMSVQGADNIPYSWILKITQTGQETGIIKYDFVITKKAS